MEQPAQTPDPNNCTPLSVSQILKSIIDPEAGVNIVDLGLIYNIRIDPNQIYVEMTMTSPACPVGDVLLDDVTSCLRKHFDSQIEVGVDLTFNPPWSPDMMSQSAKNELGW